MEYQPPNTYTWPFQPPRPLPPPPPQPYDPYPWKQPVIPMVPEPPYPRPAVTPEEFADMLRRHAEQLQETNRVTETARPDYYDPTVTAVWQPVEPPKPDEGRVAVFVLQDSELDEVQIELRDSGALWLNTVDMGPVRIEHAALFYNLAEAIAAEVKRREGETEGGAA